MFNKRNNKLISQVQAEVECVIPLGVKIQGWENAQKRGIGIVRQFTHDLDVYSADHAVNVAYVEIEKLAQVLNNQER